MVYEIREIVVPLSQQNKIINLIKLKTMLYATDIIWETDGEVVESLPSEVAIPESIDEDDYDAISDYLSDEYGYLVISYDVEKR